MAKFYHSSRIVQWYDTDAAGIAHFTAFFRWMEETEHEFLRTLGLSVSIHDAQGQITWPRVSVSADFRDTVKFEEVVELSLRIARIGNKSLSYCYDVTCGERDIATIRATAVCCRIPPGEGPISIRIPAAFVEKLADYCESTENPPDPSTPD